MSSTMAPVVEEKMVKLGQDDFAKPRALCLRRFKYFCQTFLDPKFYDPAFHGPLCDFLQFGDAHPDPRMVLTDEGCKAIESAAPKDKLVVMARTHLKTTIAAQMYSLWRATKDPNIRILITGNSSTNAEKTVSSIRGVVQSNQMFQLLFPEVIPPNFNSRDIHWTDATATLIRSENYPEGTWEAAGIGANVIRRHYNVIIEDDTVAPKKDELSGEELMPSRDEIEKAVGFHKLTIPLLIPPVDQGERIYIGTRWASYDAISYIMSHEMEGGADVEPLEEGEVPRFYASHDIPAITADGKNAYKNFSLTALAAIRRSLGPYLFNALYLNRPLASALMKFRPEWTRYYGPDTGVDLPEDGHATITVDPADAPTGRTNQCYSVALAARNSSLGLFVLEYMRDRVGEGTLIERTLDLADKWDALTIRIEVDRYANLEAGFRLAMEKRGKYYSIEPVKTRGRNKEARILRIVPIMENGRLFLRRGMRELESELYQFPHSPTNDIIDALAWQIMSDLEMPKRPTQVKEKQSESVHTFAQILASTQPKGRNNYPFSTGKDVFARFGLSDLAETLPREY